MLMGSKSATGCRERERDVSDRLLLVDRVWVGYACVCARALERREKFHGGRVRRSRHFCIIAPGSDIQTGRPKTSQMLQISEGLEAAFRTCPCQKNKCHLFGTHRCLVFVFFV